MVWSIPTERKVLYLTFDDGPIPEVTPWVLERLAEYDAKATFFCIGDNVQKHPEIFEQVCQAGHGIGNHTFHHLSGWTTKDFTYFRNTMECAAVVDSQLFRPPYGRIKKSQSKALKERFDIIMWDVLSADYDRAVSPEKCLSNVVDNAGPGSIIVFHDSLRAQKNMAYALPLVLEHFSNKGYTFEALPERIS